MCYDFIASSFVFNLYTSQRSNNSFQFHNRIWTLDLNLSYVEFLCSMKLYRNRNKSKVRYFGGKSSDLRRQCLVLMVIPNLAWPYHIIIIWPLAGLAWGASCGSEIKLWELYFALDTLNLYICVFLAAEHEYHMYFRCR